jgi:hypothetical protein
MRYPVRRMTCLNWQVRLTIDQVLAEAEHLRQLIWDEDRIVNTSENLCENFLCGRWFAVPSSAFSTSRPLSPRPERVN